MTTSLRIHEIAEGDARILNPVSLDQLYRLGNAAGVTAASEVLDIGCSKGEMLTHWASWFGCTDRGVDASADFLHAASSRARELEVEDRVAFTEGDAENFETQEQFGVVCCIGASWFAGDLARSMARMQSGLYQAPRFCLASRSGSRNRPMKTRPGLDRSSTPCQVF